MVGEGAGAVVGVVEGGLVGGGLVGVLWFGADVGRVVVDEDGLDAGCDVEGTVDSGAEFTERTRVPLVWTVKKEATPCPPACDFVWSPSKK